MSVAGAVGGRPGLTLRRAGDRHRQHDTATTKIISRTPTERIVRAFQDKSDSVAEEMLSVNGVELCAESFGDAAIRRSCWSWGRRRRWTGGSPSSASAWRRDRGTWSATTSATPAARSRTQPGAPTYGGADLVADIIGVLDAYGVERGHLVGESMGGALAQVAALEFPERVASLTLIATSPAGPAPDLPSMTEEATARFSALATPDWSDREAVIDYIVAFARACASPSAPFDEDAARELAAAAIDRSADVEATFTNHDLIDGPDPWRDRLGDLAAPTLVIHGTDDPLFPLAHGEALADEIPGARLLVLDGVGHEHPRRAWDRIVAGGAGSHRRLRRPRRRRTSCPRGRSSCR